jgi:hypothetical protein
MIAAITPGYFRSIWTVAEWKTFDEREKRSASKPGLLFPIVLVNLGNSAPKWFLDRNNTDMQKSFSSKISDARDIFSPIRSLELNRQILALAEELSSALSNVPAYSDWPVVSPEDAKALIDSAR